MKSLSEMSSESTSWRLRH